MASSLVTSLAKPNRMIALATTITAAVLFIITPPVGVPPDALKGAALGLFAVGLYGTVAVPEHLTALLFFTIAMVFAVAPAPVVFSGFHSGAFWLVFGGLVVGVAVQKTGLGVRLATAVTSRLPSNYPSMVIGVAAVGLGLAFVMPSTMGRVVLLTPIVVALCDHLKYEAGSRERTGLILAMACGTWMPSSGILPSNVPNMVLVGVAETLFGMTFTYGDYMLTHMPVNGLTKLVLIIGLVMVLFPGRRGSHAAPAPDTTPLSADGRKLAVILALTLGFWVTDFIHGISPAWIALAAAVACLWPGIGLVSGDDLRSKVNFPTTFYVASILSLGAVLVETGAGDFLGGWMLHHLPLDPDAPFTSFYAVVGLGALVNMASTAPSVPAILGPLADELATGSGIPLRTIMMTQVISYSTVVLPYQVPPVIVAMQLGGVSMRDGAKMTLALAVVSLVVLVPLNYLWWSWLGIM
tara:strand:- start:95809 stop:97209 length:1401 start_codon:yes stop_codon:yes gene_type:complete